LHRSYFSFAFVALLTHRGPVCGKFLFTGGGAPTAHFVPVVPWAKAGPAQT
jgi:hypothetical protein